MLKLAGGKTKLRKAAQKKLTLSSLALIAIVLAVGAFYVRASNQTHNQPLPSDQSQSSPSSTDGNGNGSTANQGTSTPTPSNQTNQTNAPSVTSASGAITLETPTANSQFKDGDIISGKSNLNQVWYRLKDNNAGVLANGPITVQNGSFSSAIHFTAQGTSGSLQIYSFDPNTGAEINELSVDLRF